MRIVLASSSPYRARQLKQLGLNFDQSSPEIDETRRDSELMPDLAVRLAREKAEKVASAMIDGLAIGSDQVAALGDQQLGKPYTQERAIAQLHACSGETVRFYTGVAVANAATGITRSVLSTLDVRFRDLSDEEVATYIMKENPLFCAGSFKCESLGIALFEEIQGGDPSSLIGLPLIALCKLLRQEGVDPILTSTLGDKR